MATSVCVRTLAARSFQLSFDAGGVTWGAYQTLEAATEGAALLSPRYDSEPARIGLDAEADSAGTGGWPFRIRIAGFEMLQFLTHHPDDVARDAEVRPKPLYKKLNG